jgi:hypothetical protein
MTDRKFSVVTTFNQSGLDLYGQRMIDSFVKNWPGIVQLHVYAEGCQPIVPQTGQVILHDLNAVGHLARFKQRWKSVPHANGDISQDPIRRLRKDAKKEFKWNAVRFAHKVYAVFDAAKTVPTDVLLWMDADMVCHSPILVEDLSRLFPVGCDLGFLGRKGKFSECGLYAMSLNSPATRQFLSVFQQMYDQAESGIFTLDEWHDSFVFDAVRKRVSLTETDWSSSLGDIRPHVKNSPGEGHPLINSEWGRWLDHLKGDRKQTGRSWTDDVKVARTETYWQIPNAT